MKKEKKKKGSRRTRREPEEGAPHFRNETSFLDPAPETRHPGTGEQDETSTLHLRHQVLGVFVRNGGLTRVV